MLFGDDLPAGDLIEGVICLFRIENFNFDQERLGVGDRNCVGFVVPHGKKIFFPAGGGAVLPGENLIDSGKRFLRAVAGIVIGGRAVGDPAAETPVGIGADDGQRGEGDHA